MNDKPVLFSIVHGAWQSSAGWCTVINLLQAKGYATLPIDLPGHGNNMGYEYSDIHLHTYVNYVCDTIRPIQDKYRVVLIGHSMGGIVISQVAENLTLDQLIYVSAFLPVDGESLIDTAKHSTIDGVSKNMVFDERTKSISLTKEGLEEIFYNDCSEVVRSIALSSLQAQPLLPLFDKVRVTKEKFGKTSKSYIECNMDQAIGIELQKFMNHRWQCNTYSLDTGHAPFYSSPEKLANILAGCID